MSKSDMQEIAFCITTFERPQYCKGLIKSIRKFYPDAKIYVADQSEEEGTYDAEVIRLPYDCGLSYARNYLWRNTKEPFKLLLDDDFVFTQDTKIETFRTLIDHCDIVCGGVIEGRLRNYEHDLRIEGDKLYYDKPKREWQQIEGVKCRQVDMALNFGLFRRNTDNWDDNLKICEHTDYYLRFKGKLLYTPEVLVNHLKARPKGYRRLRRRNQFYAHFMEKHGLTEIHNGRKVNRLVEGKVV